MADALIEQHPNPLFQQRQTTVDEIPFYDEGLGHMQGREHAIVVYELAGLLDVIARQLGLLLLCDHAVWYPNPESSDHQIRSPDLALACESAKPPYINAHDLLFAMEVVSKKSRAHERKDTVTMKALNAKHGVQEYALYYPQIDDERCLFWYRLNSKGEYSAVLPDADGVYWSSAVPGLQLRARAPELWEPGRKIDVYFNGKLLSYYNTLNTKYSRLATEHTQLETEHTQLETEHTQLETEHTQLEAEHTQLETQRDQLETELRRLTKKYEQERAVRHALEKKPATIEK